MHLEVDWERGEGGEGLGYYVECSMLFDPCDGTVLPSWNAQFGMEITIDFVLRRSRSKQNWHGFSCFSISIAYIERAKSLHLK